MTTPNETTEDMAALFQHFSEKFASLREQRHKAGAAEYGIFTFLGNDVIRMMAEELADTANYCEMQFIKLMILQAHLENTLAEQELVDPNEEITIGLQAFKGTKKGWDDGNQGH